MGLGDKFKNLAKQAQDAVADHKDQIHDAVDKVSVAADQRTHGKYTDKIARFGQKAGSAVDRVGGDEGSEAADAPAPAAQAAPAAADATRTEPSEPAPAPQFSEEPTVAPPKFDDE